MSFLLQPFQIVFAVLSEFVRQEQEKVNEYLQLENQILREKIASERILLDNDQRRLLAVKGKVLGRQQLAKIATIAQADTILRWHRELIVPRGNPNSSHNIGRPPTDQKIVDLVLRMARENVSWGYQRIASALHNLGYTICRSTVANILRQHGIEPAPSRQRSLSWSIFLKAHWDVFAEIDLETITLWLSELAHYFMGHTRYKNNASIVDAAAATVKELPQQKMVSFHICNFLADAPTQIARAPPIVASSLSSTNPGNIRRAA